jgi:tetratricopeptide (TPR) repeat protein
LLSLHIDMGFLKPLTFLIFSAFLVFSTHSSLAQSEQGTDYASIVKQADNYFASADYIKAKTSYEYALRIRPNEAYPKAQLDKTLKKLREQMMVMEEYSDVIAQADKFFWSREYDNALAKYQEASQMVPGEGYPKQKITEIEGIRAEERKIEVAYKDAIYRAERFEKYRKYDEAIAQYEKALEVSAGNDTLVDKIEALRVAKVQYEQTQQDYIQIIAEADRLFSLKFYDNARDEYQKAADAKPNEEYPAQQLELIRPLIEKKKEFDFLVERGDELYVGQDFAGALANYEEALKIHPDEDYPQTMIERVKEALANPTQVKIVSQESKSPDTVTTGTSASSDQDAYTLAVADGDRLFGLQNYEEAKLAYLKAAHINPDEQYPRDRMTEIEDLLYAAGSTDAAYNRVVSAGDRMFEDKDYEKAQVRYNEALQIKPGSMYPLERLKEIDQKLFERELEVQKSYNESISQADALYAKGELSQARIAYQQSLKFKPEEGYPRQQINIIDLQSDEVDKLKTDYMRIVGEADQLFTSKEYQKAKEKYIEASAIFPDEIHPKNRIESINVIFRGDYAKFQKEYDKTIADADKFLAAGVYDQALNAYRKASSLMPDEYYPPQMIDRIMKILGDNAIRKVVTSPIVIEHNQQKDFSFEPLSFADRGSSILLIKARNLTEGQFRIILGYGKDKAKKGGVTIPVQSETGEIEYIVLVGRQYPWSSEDNNFISLTAQGGTIEITLMEISKGE